MRDLGYVEGQDFSIEARFADGNFEHLPFLVGELLSHDPDVLFVATTPANLAAKAATSKVPIVMVAVADPIGVGLISNLAHPGANLTGLTILAPELTEKRLELLKELMPGISRVVAFWDPTTGKAQVAKSEKTAVSLNLHLQILEVRNRDAISGAFAAARESRAEALNVFASPILSSLSREIITLAAEYRLPTIYQWRESVEAGGLLSYGVDLASIWRQSGVIVGKVLKGETPANLPIEQPARFELAVNAKTAMVLNLPIPPNILVRADTVID